MTLDVQAALRHAGALQRVTNLRELIDATYEAVVELSRFRHTWLALFESQGATHMRVVQFAGGAALGDLVFATCPLVPIQGDPLAEAIVTGRAPVVVDDAQHDPRTNKDIVTQLGNRTLVNIPLVLGTELLGCLGVGTFGEEGVMPPTVDELEALTVLSMQVAAAYSRWQILEQRRETERQRRALERHLESLQRVEMMGVLASGVAHDLNNYLTVIGGGLAQLEEGFDPEVLADLRHASQRSAEVTQQLLALGRAQAPRRELVRLAAHVEGTLQLVRPTMPRGVAVVVELVDGPVVEADPVQVDQVLANLLLNARDAVGERGTIRVHVDEQVLGRDFAAQHGWARPGRFGRVRVCDDGHGIAAEHLARVFDPLFSTKRDGTGLGLAVVSQLVRQHEGLIHCDSTVGKGSTFAVYLPVATEH